MKKEHKILSIYTLAVLASTVYLPWILIVIIAFIFGYLFKANRLKTFTLSFLSPFIIWITIALIRNTGYIKSISNIVSDLLGGIGESSVYLITGLSIGLVCGFAGLTGQSISHLITQNDTDQ